MKTTRSKSSGSGTCKEFTNATSVAAVKLTSRFNEGLVFAAIFHRKQRRKSSRAPYLSHLLAVAAIALEHGATEDEAIAALLHDAVEDQGGVETLKRIRDTFGSNVAEIVIGCSDSNTVRRSQKPPWRKRKQKYIASLSKASPSVILVSASDKLHNIRSLIKDYQQMGERMWSVFKGGKAGTLWYYRAVSAALARRSQLPLVSEVIKAVADLNSAVRSRP